IVTLVSVAVEEVLDGDVAAPLILLEEDGGVVGNRRAVVLGAPQFTLGERDLLFLDVRSDGSLRTSQMALGKLRLQPRDDGQTYASQQIGDGVVLLGTASPSRTPDTLSAIRAAIARQQRAAPRSLARNYSVEPAIARDFSLQRQFVADFNLMQPGTPA